VSGPGLAVESVTQRFGGIEALRDVSLVAEPGSLVGVLGPNGAGKTTLLDVISGRLRPLRGAVRWEGVDLSRLPPHRIAALGVGRTFQVARLFPGLAALDNVLVGVTFGDRRAGPARERRRRARDILGLVGLGDRGGIPAARLSLGEQKRLELAVALGTAPRLLLLDEPGGGLPPRARDEIYGACEGLRRHGLTIVASEHEVERLARRADQLVVLDQGRVIARGRPADVLASPRIAEAYLGEAVE
jgi:branched-chain amino acid transport system ATP-binding protein